MVGIFPNDASITRLVGSMMLEQNDEWRLNRDCMPPEGLQSHCDTVPDLAVRCGSLSAVYLSLSGLGTYTTGWDMIIRHHPTHPKPIARCAKEKSSVG